MTNYHTCSPRKHPNEWQQLSEAERQRVKDDETLQESDFK